jgi:hypothetical protein
MSKKKIESLINEAVGEYKSIPEAAGLIIEMLKEDYNFEFPVEFDYKKCSYNRRGDKVLFVELEPNKIFYVYKSLSTAHLVIRTNLNGRVDASEETELDLIMDKK